MLEAVFTTGVSEITVTGLTQWDRGQTMQIACPNLPSAFQVHFANRKSKKAVVVQATGANNVATVVIPDVMLQQPFELFAYLYFDENLIGETTKTVRMPVERRKKPDDYIIDLPQEQATNAEKIVMKLMDEYMATHGGGGGSGGVTFYPNVDSEGTLSWSNSGGLTNPKPVNLKPVKGEDYFTASDKAEMVDAVIVALPAAEGEGF